MKFAVHVEVGLGILARESRFFSLFIFFIIDCPLYRRLIHPSYQLISSLALIAHAVAVGGTVQ